MNLKFILVFLLIHHKVKNVPRGTILLFQSPGKGIQLEDGTLIIPIQQWKDHHAPVPVRAGFIYSTNHGFSWQMSYTLVPTRSSESAILEYLPNQLLMSSRDDQSTGRRFYTTNDLGKTWIPHASDSTILESNGCQSSMIKIKAPNGRYYGLYAAPQRQGHTHKRTRLTLMMTTNFIKWNTLTEVIYGENDGHSCLAYNKTNQKLFILTEESGSLIFYDLTHFLPLIMQNTLTYHNQYTSLCHPNPVYSQGHYINTDKLSNWYELLTVKLKQSSYLLLKLNLLRFESECDITLKIKQESAILHDTNDCQLYLQNISSNLKSTDLILVPQEYEEGYFIYKLYYLSSLTNSFLSLSVLNCLYSEEYHVILNINTNQRCLHSKNSLEVLPLPYSSVNYIHPIIK